MGISIWQIILLIVFVVFIWFSIKVARHSFGFLNKAKESGADPISSANEEAFDLSDFQFVADRMLSEMDVVSTEEEIPLDNRHGSSPLVSEHEFTRTVTNSFLIIIKQRTDGMI